MPWLLLSLPPFLLSLLKHCLSVQSSCYPIYCIFLTVLPAAHLIFFLVLMGLHLCAVSSPTKA